MAKNSVRDFDATAANNTDIQSVDIAENCAPSGINNAIRELMADIKDVSAGTVALESPQADSMTVTGDLTVDTDTLFVDASANAVGIGTTSPTHALSIEDSDFQQLLLSGARPTIFLKETDGNANENYQIRLSDGDLQIQTQNDAQTGATTRVLVDSSGNVGIGTSSPTRTLFVNGQIGASGRIHTANGSATDCGLGIGDDNTGLFRAATNTIGFSTNGTERMRIDSSGNLLVGKTSTDFDTAGILLGSVIHGIRDGAHPLALNRKTDDGDIIQFYKDGTTVGSIGNESTTLYISSSQAGGLRYTYSGSNPIIAPCDTSGANLDNSADLGFASARFDDIFATNTTIQTSDANEKQQIASLTDAEITAAKAISKLFKTFKWNDSVEAKGDNARKHTGHIAQEVQQAMTDAGLDAANYAFWCLNTWWETQTEVPAVEAVEAQDAVLDDDGNIVTEAVEAVEAQDGYTRTDIYETADEAPEGATERTRLGIRYPELLAFIGAATEQRLTSIEARLTALEG